MTKEQHRELLAYARACIASRFDGIQPHLSQESEYREKKGIFVSLHERGELRGCIGYVTGIKPLGDSIRDMAQAAAFRDSRFPALRAGELKGLEIEISVLSELILISGPEDVIIGRDGLLLEHPYGSGLLLPQVATDWNWDARTFVGQVCRKAGLNKQAWKDKDAQLYRFTAEVFGESDENG
ncbi:MAG TPA: AmmeMemoRadiSam system protein A [Candidatus Cloacimonadota bacterium]|nr:AmmeMemoRadiSam system protein A [Candidatus Cloacimonadota bacterium]